MLDWYCCILCPTGISANRPSPQPVAIESTVAEYLLNPNNDDDGDCGDYGDDDGDKDGDNDGDTLITKMPMRKILMIMN